MIKHFYSSLPFLLVFVFLCGFPFCNDHQSFGVSRYRNSWWSQWRQKRYSLVGMVWCWAHYWAHVGRVFIIL